MQANPVADKLGGEKIALDELAGGENGGNGGNVDPIGPELDEGDADRQHKADEGTHIGDKTQNARSQSDQKSKVQSGERKTDGVKEPQQ